MVPIQQRPLDTGESAVRFPTELERGRPRPAEAGYGDTGQPSSGGPGRRANGHL